LTAPQQSWAGSMLIPNSSSLAATALMPRRDQKLQIAFEQEYPPGVARDRTHGRRGVLGICRSSAWDTSGRMSWAARSSGRSAARGTAALVDTGGNASAVRRGAPARQRTPARRPARCLRRAGPDNPAERCCRGSRRFGSGAAQSRTSDPAPPAALRGHSLGCPHRSRHRRISALLPARPEAARAPCPWFGGLRQARLAGRSLYDLGAKALPVLLLQQQGQRNGQGGDSAPGKGDLGAAGGVASFEVEASPLRPDLETPPRQDGRCGDPRVIVPRSLFSWSPGGPSLRPGLPLRPCSPPSHDLPLRPRIGSRPAGQARRR
jgi:hypothetical protein